MGLRILIIGCGGREHALAWKCRQSPKVERVLAAPGGTGMGDLASSYAVEPDDIPGLVDLAAKERVDFAIVGPEAPLLDGIVDAFAAAGIDAYGPTKAAAVLEGSKSEAKRFMNRWNIPTAAHRTCTNQEEAFEFLEAQGLPVVVKADGLAAGKGVVVAMSEEEAKQAIEHLLTPGNCIVMEEFMVGEEVSLLSFVDGDVVVPMEFAQDHKPVFDGDRGPNTGGMGAYSPVPQFGREVMAEALETIVKPTARAMVKEGRPFRGVLYTGLMITDEGPKVVEYNVRFGDPEAQALLPRLETDLVDIICATFAGRLHEIQVQWKPEAACAVVAASQGYPGPYAMDKKIRGDVSSRRPDSVVFHSGTKRRVGRFVTAGGRVLTVTGFGPDLFDAMAAAYGRLDEIHFEGMHYRTDIGWQAAARGAKRVAVH